MACENHVIKIFIQHKKVKSLKYIVEPRFFELPKDRQSSSKNRGFEKSNDLEKRSVLMKNNTIYTFCNFFSTKLVCYSGVKETGDGTLLLT